MIAAYPITANFGIEIVSIDDNECHWKWTNDNAIHMSNVCNGKFRANHQWISLDNCMKI